jgi:hypothetical protein
MAGKTAGEPARIRPAKGPRAVADPNGNRAERRKAARRARVCLVCEIAHPRAHTCRSTSARSGPTGSGPTGDRAGAGRA